MFACWHQMDPRTLREEERWVPLMSSALHALADTVLMNYAQKPVKHLDGRESYGAPAVNPRAGHMHRRLAPFLRFYDFIYLDSLGEYCGAARSLADQKGSFCLHCLGAWHGTRLRIMSLFKLQTH